MDNESFVVFRSFWNAYKNIKDKEVAKEFLEEIFRYGFEGEIISENPVVLALMEVVRQSIDSTSCTLTQTQSLKFPIVRIIENATMDENWGEMIGRELKSELKSSIIEDIKVVSPVKGDKYKIIVFLK